MADEKTHHTHESHTEHEAKHVVAEGHKAAKEVHKVDSAVYAGEVIMSGNPKRAERYFLRKLGYHFFAKFFNRLLGKI